MERICFRCEKVSPTTVVASPNIACHISLPLAGCFRMNSPCHGLRKVHRIRSLPALFQHLQQDVCFAASTLRYT